MLPDCGSGCPDRHDFFGIIPLLFCPYMEQEVSVAVTGRAGSLFPLRDRTSRDNSDL